MRLFKYFHSSKRNTVSANENNLPWIQELTGSHCMLLKTVYLYNICTFDIVNILKLILKDIAFRLYKSTLTNATIYSIEYFINIYP